MRVFDLDGRLSGVWSGSFTRDLDFDAAGRILDFKNSDTPVYLAYTFDAEHYKNRNLIERFFCLIKQFGRIATRYDKLASRYSSFISLTASFIWLA